MKKLILPILLVVIAGGGYFAYTKGLIPGAGEGSKVASDLKAEIESMQGNKIEGKIMNFILANEKITSQMTPEQLAKVKEEAEKAFKEDIELSLDYSDIKASSGEGKGSVKILNPKITLQVAKESIDGEAVLPELNISRSVTDANHYFYNSVGDLEIFANIGGSKTKVLALAQGENQSEIKLNDKGEMTYAKAFGKGLKIIEGRGNTTLVSIAETSSEYSLANLADGQIESKAKMDFKTIEFGDMVKLMLGPIKPINISADVDYKGDDIQKAVEEYTKNMQQRLDDFDKSIQDPEYKPAEVEKPKFGGDLKISKFSVDMSGAGFITDASLEFKRDNQLYIPTGDVNITITKYQELINYVTQFFPAPKEQLDKGVEFLKEIGESSGDDIKLKIKLDGTENVLVGGKTKAEIEAIQLKYFPPVASSFEPTNPDEFMPAELEPVESQPIQ